MLHRARELLAREQKAARETEEKRRAAVKRARKKRHRIALKAMLKRRLETMRHLKRIAAEIERLRRLDHARQAIGRLMKVSRFLKGQASPMPDKPSKITGLTAAFGKFAARRNEPQSEPPPERRAPRLRALFRSKHFAKLRR